MTRSAQAGEPAVQVVLLDHLALEGQVVGHGPRGYEEAISQQRLSLVGNLELARLGCENLAQPHRLLLTQRILHGQQPLFIDPPVPQAAAVRHRRLEDLGQAFVQPVRQAAFAPDPESRQPREKQLTLATRLVWKDLRSGKVLVDQPIELQAVDYLTATGETEKYAIDKSVDGMARRIVAKMCADW